MDNTRKPFEHIFQNLQVTEPKTKFFAQFSFHTEY